MVKKIWLVGIGLVVLITNGYCDLQYEKPFLMGKVEYFGFKEEIVSEGYVIGEFSGGVGIGGGLSLSPSFTTRAFVSSYKTAEEAPTYIHTTPVTIRRSLEIIPVTVSCIYNLSDKTPTPYIGGGIDYYSVKIRKDILGVSAESKKENTIGPHLLLGVDLLVSPRISVNGEVKYSMAKVKDWGDMEIGGLSAGGGINLILGKEGKLVEFEKWKKNPKKGRVIGTAVGAGIAGGLGYLLYIAAGLSGFGSDPVEPSPFQIIVPAVVGGIIDYSIGDHYDEK